MSLCEGNEPEDMEQWWDQPWRITAVKVWVRMLWKYEGVTDDLDSNLLTELQDLMKAGKTSKPIHYVKRELEQLMEAPQKRFTTSAEVC